MKVFLKDRWVLLLVLCAFIVCKIPHLSYAYYWDESWPYASAIRAMYDHGVSMMPGALDPELSRGHPLFFHAVVAGWMKVFGISHIATHSFALLISVLFLVAIFEVGLKLFNRRVAVMAILLVVSLEIYIVQSSFVLLEVLVAFLCFLSLYFYVRDKYLLTALCLSALFYTKESGLMLGFVLGVDALAGIFYKNTDRRESLLRLASLGVPCVLIGIFFVLQKHIRGWYIFPLHVDSLEHDWKSFWIRFRMFVVTDTFYRNFRFYYFLLLGLIGIVACVKTKKARFLAVIIPILFIYYFVDDMRAGRILPSVPFFTLFVIAWLWCAHVLSHSDVFKTYQQRRFVFLAGSFILLFLCFSAFNFFVYRYLLVVIVLLMFVTAALFDSFIAHSYQWLYYVSLAVFGVIAYFAFSIPNPNYGDCDLGAFDAMEVQQSVVDLMEDSAYYDKHIASGAFLERTHLTNPSSGFLRKGKIFKHVKWDFDDSTELIIFNNMETDYRYNNKNEWQHFRLVRRFQKGFIWSEVYRREQ